MANLFKEEGKGVFSVRTVRLGHMCQGLYPSPLDRVRAAQFAALAIQFLTDHMGKDTRVVVVGKVDGELCVQVRSRTHYAQMLIRIPTSRTTAKIISSARTSSQILHY